MQEGKTDDEHGSHNSFPAKEEPTPQGVLRFLDSLPSSKTREWETQLTKLVTEYPNTVPILEDILYDCESVVDECDCTPTSPHHQLEFSAFFGYGTRLRRNHEIAELGELLDRCRRFENRPMYRHLQVMYLKREGGQRNLEKAQRVADNVTEHLSNHPGFLHSRASLNIEFFEDGRLDPKNEENQDRLEQIKSDLDRAIDQNPSYAKFYATRARLEVLMGDYPRAKGSVRQAIKRENEEKDDYSRRIANYQQILGRIRIKSETAELAQEIETVEEELQDAREEVEKVTKNVQMRSVQFIGFFAALLAVIVTSANILINNPSAGAAALLTIVIGGVFGAVGGFSLILPTEENWARAGILSAVGAILFVLGWAYFLI